MSLTYKQLEHLVVTAAPSLEGAVFVGTQQKNAYSWLLLFQKNDEPLQKLLVALHHPFTRLHLTQAKAQASDSPFSIKLEKSLKNKRLQKLHISQNDRIVSLHFTEGLSVIIELIPKRSNFLLLDKEQKVLTAWKNVPYGTYQPPNAPSLPDKDIVLKSHAEIEKLYEELELQKRKEQLVHNLKKRLKNVERLHAAKKEELKTQEAWEAVHQKALILQANLYQIQEGMETIELDNWFVEGQKIRFAMDRRTPAVEQAKRLFKQAQKLKHGMEPTKRFLEKLTTDIETLSHQIAETEAAETLPPVKLTTVREKPEPTLPYREFISASGLKIWVGKSARDNDALTFRYAHGSDWWLHVHHYAGSHVILKVPKQQEPDQESLREAMQLALAHSKAKNKGEAEICIAQRKFVSRAGRNQPGKVTISKHRLAYVKMDNQVLDAIKNRNFHQ